MAPLHCAAKFDRSPTLHPGAIQGNEGIQFCHLATLAREGLLAFWRGNLASVLLPFSNLAVNYALKDKIKVLLSPLGSQCRECLQHSQHTHNNASYSKEVAKSILSGGCAGSITLAFVYPLVYARTRMANDVKSVKNGISERKFDGLIDVYRKTLKSDGVRGVYRGFVINCGGHFVHRGIYFGLYDSLKSILVGENSQLMTTKLFTSFILSYGVTLTAGLMAYPMGTINRRMMMTSGEAMKYKSSWDCCTQIIKKEGYMALMKGASIHILLSVAGAGVLMGYDAFKGIYKNKIVQEGGRHNKDNKPDST